MCGIKRVYLQLFGMVALSTVIVAETHVSGADAPYRLVKEIAVGGEGGWDYLSIDASARRLYVSHGGTVVVVDLDKEAVVGETADAPGVHGVALAPELARGFSSNGRENRAGVVDLKTLKTLWKVPTGENPDAILYEPGRQEVYAFNGRGRSATVTSRCVPRPAGCPRSTRRERRSTRPPAGSAPWSSGNVRSLPTPRTSCVRR